jgi:hypothetical protein
MAKFYENSPRMEFQAPPVFAQNCNRISALRACYVTPKKLILSHLTQLTPVDFAQITGCEPRPKTKAGLDA